MGAVCFFKRIGRELRFEIDRLSFGRRRPNNCLESGNWLDKAAGIGRAADACASAGFHEKGLEVALDIEQLLYEATTLVNAASLINRIARQS